MKQENRPTEQVLPFFARYLETQALPAVNTDVKAGAATQKFPSDSDEVHHTMKYPSDGDEV